MVLNTLVTSNARLGSNDIRELQNQATPTINRLPPEVLQMVLKFTLPDSETLERVLCAPTLCYYSKLFQLCGVSSYWASLIANTTSFWTYTSQADCDELTAAVLARSKNSPLQVRYVVHDCLDCRCRENPSYLGMIVAQCHRWQSLCVYDADRMVLKQLLAAPAPQLRYLDVLNCSAPAVLVADPVTGPKIVDLMLAKVSLDWEAWRFSGLQNLQLEEVIPGPTLEQLIDIIQSSPNLRILVILDCDVAIASHETPGWERSPSPCPRTLDVLRLSEVSAKAMCGILSCVTTHDQSEVYFDLSEGWDLSKDEAVLIMTFAFRHLGALAPSYLAAKIAGSDYTLEYTLDINLDAKWGIKLRCTEGEMVGDLVYVMNDVLAKAVPKSHNIRTTLQIVIMGGIADPLLIMNAMNDILDIRDLMLVAPLHISVLEPLRCPLPSGRWLFPNLERLELDQFDAVVDETLPAVVQARWEAADKANHENTKSDVVCIKDVSIGAGGSITRDAQVLLETSQTAKQMENLYIHSETLIV